MQTPFLRTAALFSILSLSSVTVFSQAKENPSSTATINVVVTDYKQAPLKGQQVFFIDRDQKKLGGKTNSEGKFSLRLPAGNVYLIRLKTLTDTANYSSMEIPALQPGQSFNAPFTVTIKYQPAKSFTLNNVQFDSGKPTLRAESYKELNEIAEYMNLKEDENYEIAGHTDNVGNDEDNLKLSQQRAESVKTYLVKKGVGAARLSAKGYGASKPIADNATSEGRQKNRRTEVIIL